MTAGSPRGRSLPDERPPEPMLHVDLDAFYASVEVLKDPSLAGRPVIVGGVGGRGVVSSASYEAREYGVRSAMPTVRARRICPDGVFVPPDFEAYKAHSNRFREVLLAHTPLVEPISLDEAFLDVGGATMLFGDPPNIAARIRAEVEREVGVTCSVGVASTKFVAKLASDHCKPNGMLVVPADGVLAFLGPLPVGRLWGVGKKTGDVLSRLAVRTISDLAATPEPILARLLGAQHATHLSQLAQGIDDRGVVPYEAPKSVGNEETFEHDVDDDETLLRELLALSGNVASRLRADGYRARTVTMKVRLATFTTLTRSKTMADATDVGADLYRAVADLYKALPGQRRRVRLLGVQATGLVPAGAEQLALLRGERWGDVERAIDRIEQRFGSGSAMPASLLDRSKHGHQF
ncbi:MAG: DNA polymerase IV [Actinomycetota bacterium]|nr:DNA polymerase IV [Actinomycetota bacterium]MDH5223713.1 DNA polymerase IV [Actinomycetota bacterium]MDH5312728.1 DNA polymerase IV [Actinomycetota bacterium]